MTAIIEKKTLSEAERERLSIRVETGLISSTELLRTQISMLTRMHMDSPLLVIDGLFETCPAVQFTAYLLPVERARSLGGVNRWVSEWDLMPMTPSCLCALLRERAPWNQRDVLSTAPGLYGGRFVGFYGMRACRPYWHDMALETGNENAYLGYIKHEDADHVSISGDIAQRLRVDLRARGGKKRR